MKIFSGKFKNQKKGSLQLSINAIVILILAITLLGLGLGFIKGMFKGTLGKLTKIEQQLGEEERKTLLDSSAEITFLTSRVQVEGRETELNLAIRNNRPNWLNFAVLEGFSCFDAIGKEAAENAGDWITFETYETRIIEATKSDIIPLKVSVSPDAKPTIYSCMLDLKLLGEGNTRSDIADYAGGPQDYSTKIFEIEYKK